MYTNLKVWYIQKKFKKKEMLGPAGTSYEQNKFSTAITKIQILRRYK